MTHTESSREALLAGRKYTVVRSTKALTKKKKKQPGFLCFLRGYEPLKLRITAHSSMHCLIGYIQVNSISGKGNFPVVAMVVFGLLTIKKKMN